MEEFLSFMNEGNHRGLLIPNAIIENADKLWNDLASRLNSYGPAKTQYQWKKV